MAVLYSIRDWDEHFEVAQSRKAKRTHSWVALPTKHDGKSFRRIMLLPDGPEIYGAWVLLVQIAAKCPTRGVLADKDGPLDEADFHIKTGAPQTLFSKALNVLSSRQIGWIVGVPWEGTGSALPPPTNQQTGQTIPTNQPPYPPAAAPNATAAIPEAGGQAGGRFLEATWDAVGKRLASVGVVQWSQAVANAQAAGSDPSRCHELIDFAIRHEKGPGAIAQRFKIASPQLALNSGWPNSDRPDTAAEKRAKREADQRTQRAAEEADNAAWRMVKAGRVAGKTDEQIKAEIEAAGLPWVNPASVSQKTKARTA